MIAKDMKLSTDKKTIETSVRISDSTGSATKETAVKDGMAKTMQGVLIDREASSLRSKSAVVAMVQGGLSVAASAGVAMALVGAVAF
eukprot:CAMPEP_0185605580 /NCGR_PEP_ID=MMETSP0436-20130131/4154_1 /TAXON_ID=626734 ORGANISM="Favella taraikaensis, Strain Fe Narragansett Bay" /NCGR_SAMPLE_ID=MMETSP0436 /ASSEMBLY_ACC=CAM_ASM_000390 /LENGTH=86 /DNA_ID=CAMNT_0028236837 /DNA_START=388 /DNA_END=648 /DNA_ORIENTATION=+